MKRDASATPTRGRLLVSLALRLAIVVGVVLLVDLTGFGHAVDNVLRQQYYGLRDQRHSEQRVILVAFDTPTLEAWKAPPWTTDQLGALVAAIRRGGPAAVGIVEAPGRIVADAPANVVVGAAVLALGEDAVDTALLEHSNVPTVTKRLLDEAKLPFHEPAIAINFVGKRGLPTLSALDVATGKIPSESFAGKVVVLGLTAQPQAGLVPTPIGPLTAAQIHAHALSSVADGVAFHAMRPWLRWALILVLSVAAMVLVHHLAVLGATVAVVSIVLGVLVLDFLLFQWSTSRFGAAIPIITTLLATAVQRIHERVIVRRHIAEIAHWTRQWTLLDSMRTDVPDDEPGYWLRVAGLARLYLGCTSTIVAELPIGGSHLKLRVINGTTAKLIAERRRDVRRSPYRKAHLTLGPVWHDRFMNDDKGSATLLVPLVVRTTLIGFWIVNFPSRDAVAAPHMALIKTLAREIAMAIDRRRTATAPQQPPGPIGWLLGAGRFSLDLDEVRRSFQAHTQNQQDLVNLGESMPFGVFVATLWGEIRYMNTAMKLVCKQEGLDPTSTSDGLPDVLCRLTGFPINEVHQHLRKLVQELEELHLRGRDRVDRQGRDFVLSWLKPVAGDPADTEQLILVCALPPRPDRRSSLAAAVGPRASDDFAVTMPRLKVELDDASDSRPMQALANGTPQFANEVALVPDAGLTMAPRQLPLAPDASMGLRADDVARERGDHDEVTFVAAGASPRSTRSLPVVSDPNAKSDRTMPMFKVKID